MITTEPPRKSASPRRAGLVAIVIAVIAGIVAFGAVSVTSVVFGGRFEETTTLTPQAERLTVHDNDGDVAITPSPDGAVHVTAKVSYRMSRPTLRQTSTTDGVQLEPTCTGFVANCRVDYVVQVPASFEVRVATGSGHVTIGSINGPIGVDVDSGDVDVRDVSGALDLEASSGHVRGVGVRSATVRARTDSGDVRMELQTPPQELAADVSSGHVDLAIPVDGVAYRVDVDTDSGEERVTVPVDPASSRSVRVATDSGDITVRPVR